MNFHLSERTENGKTGPMPAVTASSNTCPPCPFDGNGCYASNPPMRWHWEKIDAGTGPKVSDFDTLLAKLGAEFSRLRAGSLARYAVAGDLPGEGARIDRNAVDALDALAREWDIRLFSYTHKPVEAMGGMKATHPATMAANRRTIAAVNSRAGGFTINLSANSLRHADALADLEIGPVVTVLPRSFESQRTTKTPAGRRVIICPAEQVTDGIESEMQCTDCGLCAASAAARPIVGFPAHGSQWRAIESVFNAWS